MDWIMIILFVLTGVAVGFAGSLLGVGGGFIMVPILHLLFGFEIHYAIGTSLFTIIFTSLSSSFQYLRKRIVDTLLGATMIPFAIIGAITGANISAIIPGNILKAAFGIVLFIASIRMFLKENQRKDSPPQSSKLANFKFLSFNRTFTDYDGKIHEYVINIPLLALFGFCSGLMGGLLGIGGGVIQVPVLNLIFGVPIHISIATSLFIIIFTSSFGTVTHFFLGNVLLTVGIFLAMGTIIGGQIGAHTSLKIESGRLRKIFAIVLGFTGIRMLISIFSI